MAGTDMKAIASAEDEFPGLTSANCCATCGNGKCIISGQDACLHPRKSGLQAMHRTMPDVLAKFDRAAKLLKMVDAIRAVEGMVT
jgi:hypothetical protein